MHSNSTTIEDSRMSVFRKFRLPVRLPALLLLAACGGAGDSTGPVTPTTPTQPVTPTTPSLTLSIITATSETSPANENPSTGLAVKVTDSTGAPVKGVSLTWTVTAGGGKMVQSPAATDDQGVTIGLWALGPSAAPQTLSVSHQQAKTSAVFTGYVPIGTVTANTAGGRKYVGDTLSSYATVTDIKGTTLTGPMRVVVRDTLVATDAGNGSLVGKTDGSTYVIVVTGPSNTPKDSVRVDVYRELHGTVFTYDGSSLPALRAYSTNGTVTDSADVGANGTYRIKLTSHISGWVTEVLIDAINTGNRTYFPALMPVAADCSVRSLPNCIGSDINADISFVLVPRQYTVKRGTYVGRTLAVDMDAALGTTNSSLSFLSASGFYKTAVTAGGSAPKIQTTYSASEFAWLPDSLPIGVAIHRSCCSARTVTAADSVAVMDALNSVQTALGYNIWFPVNDRSDYKTDRSSSATPNRMLIFQYDTVLKGAITAGGSTGPINSSGNPAVTRTLQDFVVTGWRNSKVDHVLVSNAMSQAQLIGYNPAASLTKAVLVHEAMHTLGAGHGCSWTSTQSYCGLNPPDGLPTFEDAAYLLMAMDVKAAVWKNHALHSLTAALFGQRAIMMKIDPIPEVKHDGGESSPEGGS
jgi:hypothetical protein